MPNNRFPPHSGHAQQPSSYSTSREITSYMNSTENAGEERESENVEMLTAMMGDLDPNVARRVLRKCNGDVQKAATAILEGDRGEATAWSSQVAPTPPGLPEHKAPPPSVIDLTSDDDELSRALEASLLPQSNTKFGPSDRAPNPDWAMVPSNVGTSSVSHDDRSLSRAIEESLSSSYNDSAIEAYENLPLEHSVREGSRPVALRPTLATLTYAALALQALFAVPQVRESIASWRPSMPVDTMAGGQEQNLWSLVEMFTNLDMAQLSSIVADDVLERLKAEPWSSAIEVPGRLSFQFYKKVTDFITRQLQQRFDEEEYQGIRPRLFYFSYNHIGTGQYGSEPGLPSEDCIVSVDTGGDDTTSNDLISRLSVNLSRYHEDGSDHEVILEASQVIAFNLRNHRSSSTTPAASSSSSSTGQPAVVHQPFKYPKSLYLDQFLGMNFELANQSRIQQMEMNSEVQRLTLHRNAITRFEGTDTLKDLRASLHYYENLADAKGDVERQALINITGKKLRSIIATIESELEVLDAQISKLNYQSSVLFDIPELQCHKYDLRAVLMHEGLFGRKQLYSYVKDRGVWWKTVDTDVTEVSEETVLNDPAGMHLGAGPFLLIYSRTLRDEDGKEKEQLPWPQTLKDHVEYHNKEFLSSLDPAIAAKATPRYPSRSPHILPASVSRQVAEAKNAEATGI